VSLIIVCIDQINFAANLKFVINDRTKMPMYRKFIDFIVQKVLPFFVGIYRSKHIYPIVHPPLTVIRTTIHNYNRHNVFKLGAVLAYYTIFSLPALIIVVIGLVGFFFGEAAVHGKIFDALVDALGADAAHQIQNAVLNIGTPDTNWWATILGIALLFFVATGVFYSLQSSLNHIFEVESVPKRVKILEVLMNRILSLGMVLSIGGLLMVSIVLNALLLKVSDFKTENESFVQQAIPDFIYPYLDYLTNYFLVFLNLGISVFLVALFFATLFKILPAVRLRWSYIWAGSLLSALLFWLGQLVMGIYLSNTSVISAYGAAGSVIVILIWVSYSSQLIFLGAEFILALCEYRKVPIRPKNFVSALQNVKRKRNLKRELSNLSSQAVFCIQAPPSHYENRKLQLYDSIPKNHASKQNKQPLLNNKAKEASLDERLGFNADKNINLKD
jgi:membrane protein